MSKSLHEEQRDLLMALNRLWDSIAVALFVPLARQLGLKLKPRYELAVRRREKP